MKFSKQTVAGLVLAPLALLATSAHAAIDPAVDAAFTSMQTDSLAMIGKGWPILAAITVAFIGVKIFKRVAGKV